MKLLYKCICCKKDKTARAFVKRYYSECRSCMKMNYLFYYKVLISENPPSKTLQDALQFNHGFEDERVIKKYKK